MDDLNKHKIDFADGFKDGYKRSESGKFCRWIEHVDVTDGFKTPNPVYTLAYESSYRFQQMGKELTDENVEELFLKLVKHIWTKHHDEFNL